MDWMPNIDAVKFFVAEILPLIRRAKPNCSVTLVGRSPGPSLLKLGAADRRIRITGTVSDVRPYLWGSRISVVPLRVGGGTRLKIYEAMAARLPVVSTTIGAEGLEARDGEHIRIADSAEAFAARCIEMLNSEAERRRIADAGWRLVTERFSWERVARIFEEILAGVPKPIAEAASAAGASTC
jgi:glycosyltransferase involved in cell wall biosynthesis